MVAPTVRANRGDGWGVDSGFAGLYWLVTK